MVKIVIEEPKMYYSYLDEKNFFNWLSNISAIEKPIGTPGGLEININEEKIDEESLRDMLAVLMRYGVDMKPLSVFLNEANRSWFYDNKSSYWHKKIWNSEK